MNFWHTTHTYTRTHTHTATSKYLQAICHSIKIIRGSKRVFRAPCINYRSASHLEGIFSCVFPSFWATWKKPWDAQCVRSWARGCWGAGVGQTGARERRAASGNWDNSGTATAASILRSGRSIACRFPPRTDSRRSALLPLLDKYQGRTEEAIAFGGDSSPPIPAVTLARFASRLPRRQLWQLLLLPRVGIHGQKTIRNYDHFRSKKYADNASILPRRQLRASVKKKYI